LEGHVEPETRSNEHRPGRDSDPFDPEALAAELAAIDARLRDARGGAADARDEKALETEFDPTEIDPSRVRHGAPFVERKSTFQAHVLLGLRSPEEADAFAAYLKRDPKVARASHNILAYRKRLVCAERRKNGELLDSERDADDESRWACDHDDDGEHGAGKGLSHLLRVTECEDVCVVVSRWFGGVHLGPTRFQCINNAARDALVNAGVARTNATGASGSGKTGKRSGGGAK
jgi:putative IMPACT (imprinted ancient) family translation regulator